MHQVYFLWKGLGLMKGVKLKSKIKKKKSCMPFYKEKKINMIFYKSQANVLYCNSLSIFISTLVILIVKTICYIFIHMFYILLDKDFMYKQSDKKPEKLEKPGI